MPPDIAIAARLAAALGLPGVEPEIIHDGFNLTVRLAPHPIAARIATATAEFRDPVVFQTREIAVLRHLADVGAPAVRPAPEVDPGPHNVDGRWAILMRFHSSDPGRPVAGEAIGASLRALHDGLRTFAVDRLDGDMPSCLDVLAEAPALLDRAAGALAPADAQFLKDRCAVLIDTLPALFSQVQPVHGDVHLGNLLRTPDGPIWADLEDVCAGPIEWDLASLQASTLINATHQDLVECALRAYGCDRMSPLWRACLEAQVLTFTAWAAYGALTSERAAASMPARMAWHRSHAA